MGRVNKQIDRWKNFFCWSILSSPAIWCLVIWLRYRSSSNGCKFKWLFWFVDLNLFSSLAQFASPRFSECFTYSTSSKLRVSLLRCLPIRKQNHCSWLGHVQSHNTSNCCELAKGWKTHYSTKWMRTSMGSFWRRDIKNVLHKCRERNGFVWWFVGLFIIEILLPNMFLLNFRWQWRLEKYSIYTNYFKAWGRPQKGASGGAL